MKLIQPNCRVQFDAEDVDFVLSVLGHRLGSAECLTRLLADADSRDLILDDEKLFHALLERAGCLRVSSRFYFYILVRQVLRRAGLADRAVADYIAEMLAEFARSEKSSCAIPGRADPVNYFFEMLSAIGTADDRTRFVLRLHVGNYSLFLAGVFPDRIRSRAERRGAPGLSYYEGLGRTNFRLASDHPLARRYDLGPVLCTLSERFDTARRALNDISERLFSLGEETPPLPG